MLYILRLIAVLGLCLGMRLAAADPGAPLQLDTTQQEVDAWPAVTLLADPTHTATLAAARARVAELAEPDTPTHNLGRRNDTVWLHLPVQSPRGGRWVFVIDYPSLNRADVHLLADGRLVAQHRLGNDQPFSQRPLQSRSHAVALDLEPGRPYELWLRVRTDSTMVLPMAFMREDAFARHEARHQLLQGLLMGVLLAMIVYAMLNGLSLRDPLFGHYAVVLGGLAVFFTAYTGIGQQHLWDDQTGLLALVAPLGVGLSLVASGPFFAGSLGLQGDHAWVKRGLYGVSVLAAVTMLQALVGVLDYRHAQTAVTALGPLPMLLSLRPALLQARRGSAVARTMLIGWTAYGAAAVGMVALLRGALPANFWSLHLFQFGMLLEMLAWTRVLGLRMAVVRSEAEQAERDRHHLHSLAHTDPLTGLPNRRGLQDALAVALSPPGAPGRLVAVYMLDLDGFKPINDRLGHDAGDTLLIQVGQRLRSRLRSGDAVARLGGDEFVVMATSLAEEADAHALGQALLDVMAPPFQLAGQGCSVGLTVGYALAPVDGGDARTLLMRADEAMYAGKQAGRRCLRRWSPALQAATPVAPARAVARLESLPVSLPG
jgi:diguanylate cyclase (GGDEF)-like protein